MATSVGTGPDQLFRSLRAAGSHAEKIRLAQEAWDDQTFTLPRKGYYLLEWLLDRLLKTRSDKDSPILNTQCWTLVNSLLATGQTRSEVKQIVSKTPVAPALASYLARYPKKSSNGTDSLKPLTSAFKVLLPLASTPSKLDDLLTCVSHFIIATPSVSATEDVAWSELASLLLQSIQGLGGDKAMHKKISAFFLDKCLGDLLSALHGSEANQRILLDVSTCLLFSEGNLHRLFPQTIVSVEAASKSLSEVFAAFGKCKDMRAVADFLPSLFSAYIRAIRGCATELFALKGASTSSRSAAETHVQQQTRHAIFGFLKSSLALLSKMSKEEGSTRALQKLLSTMEDKAIYAAGPGEANQEWLKILQACSTSLAEQDMSDPITGAYVLEALSSLAKIDFAAIEADLPALFVDMAPLSSPIAVALFQIAIDFHGKTRQLPILFALLEDTIASVDSEADFNAIFTGPLLCIATRASLVRECTVSLGTTQVSPLVDVLVRELGTHLDAAHLTAAGAPSEPTKKKRKVGKGESSAAGSKSQRAAAMRYQALSQLLAVVFQGIKTVEGELEPSFAALQERALACFSGGEVEVTSEIERCAACTLQLQAVAPASLLTEKADVKRMLKLLGGQGRPDPLLTLELIRTLSDEEVDPEDRKVLYNRLCDLAQSGAESAEGWSGYLHDISSKTLPVAIWQLVTSQYLSQLDQYASDDQLRVIASCLLRTCAGAQDDSITYSTISQRILRSALFFEQPRLRQAVHDVLRETSEISHLLDALALLPRDYLSRDLRRSLVKTIADSSLASPAAQSLLLQLSKDDMGSPLIQDVAYLRGLSVNAERNAALISHLVRLTFKSWNVAPEKYSQLEDWMRSMLPDVQEGKDISANYRIYVIILQALVDEVSSINLPELIKQDLAKREKHLRAVLAGPAIPTETSELSCAIELANTLQRLARWLSIDAEDSAYLELGKKALAASHSEGNVTAKSMESLLALLGRSTSSESLSFDAYLAAILDCASRYAGLIQSRSVESIITKSVAAQTDADYENGVSLLLQLLEDAENPSLRSAALSVLQLLLCNPPQGAARVASQALSTTLRILTFGITDIRATATFIRRVSEQKISVLELSDAAAIWTIIGSACSAEASLAEGTASESSAIYLDLVNTTAFIAQHRRDLLTPTFPQFSQAIASLIGLLRMSSLAFLPDGRRGEVVTSFPVWAQDSQWAEARHAKAIARLLVSLGSKTTVLQRNRRKDDTSRPINASLAGPLSKHAPFILVTYLRACTDGTAPISSELRHALAPGVMELLGSMGRYEREALMKGFLASGMEAERALLRALWKDYDRVRYRGD